MTSAGGAGALTLGTIGALLDFFGKRPDEILNGSDETVPQEPPVFGAPVALLWHMNCTKEAAPHAVPWHRVSVRLGGSAEYARVLPSGKVLRDEGEGAVSVHPFDAAYGNLINGSLDMITFFLTQGVLRLLVDEEGWRGDRASRSDGMTDLEPKFAHKDDVIEGIGKLVASNSDAFSTSRLMRESLERMICRRLLQAFSALSPPAAAPGGKEGVEEPGISRAIDMMRARFAEDIGLDELAAAAGLPSGRFQTAFRAATGRTPYAWLAEMRLQQAHALITGSDLSIGEVAARTGFASISALSMACRRRFGASPRALRLRG
ncbi:MAG: helix-turn-helix domain-containing protein [Pseudomonadota bacterium]